MQKEKTNLYLLSIVGIVAVVGIVVLVLNSGSISVSDDLTGQATSTTCSDSDGGMTYTTRGTVTGGTWKTTGKTYTRGTDYCNTITGKIVEYYCSDSTHAFSTTQSCATKVGAGYVCSNGACVLDSDGDGVPDSSDVCAEYDDADDQDGDDIPDGCDDSDNDGVLGFLGSLGMTDEQIEDFIDAIETSIPTEDIIWTLTDYDELITYSTDPNDADTDDGGVYDGFEITLGTDPNDGTDDPNSVYSSGDCENGLQDGTETDVDCGRSCDRCEEGNACLDDIDCEGSLECTAEEMEDGSYGICYSDEEEEES